MQISFLWALALVFIVLKLTHVIAWSWVIVLLPIWFGLAVAAILLVIVVLIAAVQAAEPMTRFTSGRRR